MSGLWWPFCKVLTALEPPARGAIGNGARQAQAEFVVASNNALTVGLARTIGGAGALGDLSQL
ncbi:hypothetical protein ROA7023_02339 [Roseisalinus antarcticus]|uniref:Uncharacterized protein n=1 Tax=Roseisalinus antarcticus TaxID=254357 RepID=A0A1Y5T0R8_9RHOB|nr:hypothetical protein ROA7023_02339 [Roseisalinus antarcticus]